MAGCRKIFVFISTVVVLSSWVTSGTAQWLTPLTLQTGRARLVAVTANNKVYFVGGYDGSNVQNKIDVYDNATGELTAFNRTLTVGRADLAGVYNVNRNKMYFGGGQTNSSKSTVIEVFNIAANNWDAQLALPQPTAYMCAASWGDKVLFAGGSNGSSYYDEIYVYNTLTGGAPQTYHLSEGRDQISVSVIGSKVIMAGGHRGGGVYSDNIDIFDLSTEQLVSHSYQLSEARAFLSAATLDSKAFFGGGQRGSPNLGSTVVDVVDLDAPPGDIGPLQLSQPRYYLTAIGVGTKVFFAGGGLGSTPYANVDIFDISSGITTTPTIETQLSIARNALVAADVGTKALFAGGISAGNVYSNVVNIYDTETVKPTATLEPLDGATGVSYSIDPALTFTEKIKKGTGNIIIKEDGVIKATIAVGHSSVVISPSGDKITIDLDKLKSNANVTIEMAPGVIEDLAGNDFDGFVSPNVWNFQIENLVTVVPTFVNTFEKGGPNVTVSMSVNDASKLDLVRFMSRGISGDPNAMDVQPHAQNENVYTVTLDDSDFNDPIGLYYYFEYTDLSGRVDSSDDKRTYLRFPTKESSAAIPGLDHGKTIDKYEIISVPLQLDDKTVPSVFSAFEGGYDKTKWRLYDYFNGDNREYSGFSNIVPGQGYWLIMLEATDIKPGAGTTVGFFDEVNDIPFRILLKKGWNLIGNPYNFAISWEDVRVANSAFQDDLGVDAGVYSGESLTYRKRIDPYRGAFVENTSGGDLTIEIPVRKNNNIPNRVSAEEVDLSSYNWHLPITISDGVIANETGGVGMNKEATLTGRDKFDRITIPVPENMGMFEIAFPHPEINKNFVREIVPSADFYIWDFEVHKGSEKPLTLTWDNSLIVETEKQMFLVDLSFGMVKDMKVEGSFVVPSSTNSLKVIFGDKEFVRQTLDEVLPLVGYPYPNPAENEVRIPFHIPSKAGGLNVHINVFNSQGVALATLADGKYESGDHEVVWNTLDKSGLYLVQMKVGTDKVRWAKVVVK